MMDLAKNESSRYESSLNILSPIKEKIAKLSICMRKPMISIVTRRIPQRIPQKPLLT